MRLRTLLKRWEKGEPVRLREQREACFRCGESPLSSIHDKSYGSGSISVSADGEVTSTMGESYHAPWQHPYESGLLVRDDRFVRMTPDES